MLIIDSPVLVILGGWDSLFRATANNKLQSPLHRSLLPITRLISFIISYVYLS